MLALYLCISFEIFFNYGIPKCFVGSLLRDVAVNGA